MLCTIKGYQKKNAKEFPLTYILIFGTRGMTKISIRLGKLKANYNYEAKPNNRVATYQIICVLPSTFLHSRHA